MNGQQHKKALMIATVPSMIGQFNMANIQILLDLGYEVHVACNFDDRSVWTENRVEELRKQLDDLGVKYFQIDFARSPKHVRKLAESYKEIEELLFREKYTLVHVHTPVAAAEVRLAAKDYNYAIERRVKEGKSAPERLRVIYTAHGFHFYDGAPIKNWLIFYPIEKWFSRYTDVLITINKEDYKRAKSKFHAKKTVYIPGVGVDTEKFAVCKIDKPAKRAELGVKDSDFLILSVGELSERKNQKVVIEALHKMKEDGTIDNIIYFAVGKGDQEEEFRCLITEYGLEDHIKLLGFRADIDELCETVDCFVHPSVREGLGIAPLEAMAAGLPLISAAVNGIKDYTEDGVSGCCVNPTDVDEMVKAIKRMHDDGIFRKQCASNNWKTAKTFDIKNTDEIMQKIYGGGYSHLASILVRQEKRTELGIGFNDFVIISVGELNDNKNHQVIIHAIKDIPDVKYVIVGKGVLEENLRRLAVELKVSDRVILTGFRTDVRDLLWMSDCFAFPSKREGLGIAALEGMSAGLPVIGHDIGGIRDFVIDGETGMLINMYDDENAYREAIIRAVLQDTALKYRKRATEISKRFSIEESNKDMRDIYDRNGN